MISLLTKLPADWPAYGIYLLVALAVMLPLLTPGFILTLDMVFTPVLRMPDSVTSSYLFHAALHILNLVIPSEVLEKGLLLGILLLASIGMHRLLRLFLPRQQPGEWGTYIASIFFIINPYTYSRFMAGQYSVLLGYALLPWFVRQAIAFGHKPGIVAALKLSVLVSVIATVSIHTLGEVAILAAIALGLALGQRRTGLRAYGRYSIAAGAVFMVCCGFWLIPLAMGQGKVAATVQSFSAADTQAFATAGGSLIGKTGNVLRLQGFWAEDRGLYLLPQERTMLWGLMALAIITLVVIGAVAMWRSRPTPMLLFATSGVAGIIVAVGFMGGLLGHAGYREPHKFVGLLALSYSVFLAYGINSTLKWLRHKTKILYVAGAVTLLLLPLSFTRVMFWGFDGQLTPRHYPPGWQAANTQLDKDQDNFSVLMLPWHQYMTYQFAGRIIAPPGPGFFDKPVIVSQDPELSGASGGQLSARDKSIKNILENSNDSENFGRRLATNNIKYILLAKEVDYSQYADLVMAHPELQLVHDYSDIALYKNTEWRKN
ncbi:MAG TPA: hypothetical protein VLH86_03935 [Patescibacteria group bacterium]|nr:hypothetical protein [Patescibacteria group bacterium]